MNTVLSQEKNRIEQITNIENVKKLSTLNNPSAMITVYQDEMNLDKDCQTRYWHNCFPIFIPNSIVNNVFSNHYWDAQICRTGHPTIVQNSEGARCYNRFNLKQGMEPLVMYREFDNILPSYSEISEEFRLYHNLYYDKEKEQYIGLNRDGDSEVIAIVTPTNIQIRLKEIRQFLSVKDMHLSVQFQYTEYSHYKLEDLGLSEDTKIIRTNKFHLAIGFGNNAQESLSDMMGEFLIAPFSKEQNCCSDAYESEQDKSIKFIIGQDEIGREILSGKPPKGIEGFQEYLTKVCFSKQVLDKYRQQPSKYDIREGIIHGQRWDMPIDNNHDDKVYVWLGDLYKHLPYKEKLHWRSHNIIPRGGISDTFINNQILVIPTDSPQPDIVFKNLYLQFNEKCNLRLTWCLFLPLTQDDEYRLKTISLPSTNERLEFDNFILNLAHLLIESLNKKELAKLVTINEYENLNSIQILEYLLDSAQVKNHEKHIRFLRELQQSRSTGVAHRKGNTYEKREKVKGKNYLEQSKLLLISANELIEFLDVNLEIFIRS